MAHLREVIILASASPRRIELLKRASIKFEVHPAHIDEIIFPNELPHKLVCRLATEKALKISRHHPKRIVLGADTAVYFENRVIGKPASLTEARKTLLKLRGNTHDVYTGVCLTRGEHEKTLTWFAVTSVTFREFTAEELDYCLSTGQPMDKAGGYAFQRHKDILVSNCKGLRTNVIGLPVEEVLVKLNEL